jgi:hypothetical protein
LNFVLAEKFQEFWLPSIMFVIAGLFLLALLDKKLPAGGQSAPEIKA